MAVGSGNRSGPRGREGDRYQLPLIPLGAPRSGVGSPPGADFHPVEAPTPEPKRSSLHPARQPGRSRLFSWSIAVSQHVPGVSRDVRGNCPRRETGEMRPWRTTGWSHKSFDQRHPSIPLPTMKPASGWSGTMWWWVSDFGFAPPVGTPGSSNGGSRDGCASRPSDQQTSSAGSKLGRQRRPSSRLRMHPHRAHASGVR